ncbi:MBOAT family O-acyltransferase [Paenibacillus chitinolyticus]|uniref:MBOAT family O-acyltransferase n=1 Tax=Paenibacillus chitinolyticus TaxID=79263 RepID=UPI003651805F
MALSSTIFLFALLPISLIGCYLLKDKFSNIFIIAISLIFYSWANTKMIIILIAAILVNYLFALGIENFHKRSSISKSIMILSLIYNVGILWYFKYLIFTVSSINALTGATLTIPSITLPLGISFFTFRAISYVLDVYFENSKAQKNIINVGLYISFFPQLVMGPITKYVTFEKQLNERKVSFDNFAEGTRRFILGLSKKMILSNGIATMVDNVFALPDSERTILLAWMGIIGYLLQLYFDFSGYSDMAIGLSKMFGFNCPENFNYPYISKSIGEYWRRWHITLGAWFKDYVYTPVFRGIMHKKNFITKGSFTIQQSDILSLLVVWLCTGIWHGANWTFVVWGIYYFIFIVAERLIQDAKKKRAKKLRIPKREETKIAAVRAHAYTLLVIIIGQVIFRATSVSAAVKYVESMFGLYGNKFVDSLTVYYLKGNWVLILLGIIFCLPIAAKMNELRDRYMVLNRTSKVILPIVYITLFIIGVSYVLTDTYQSFIYFQF